MGHEVSSGQDSGIAFGPMGYGPGVGRQDFLDDLTVMNDSFIYEEFRCLRRPDTSREHHIGRPGRFAVAGPYLHRGTPGAACLTIIARFFPSPSALLLVGARDEFVSDHGRHILSPTNFLLCYFDRFRIPAEARSFDPSCFRTSVTTLANFSPLLSLSFPSCAAIFDPEHRDILAGLRVLRAVIEDHEDGNLGK
ncbi:hypothetical protein DL764_006590 [Monosporascus ibericus]|uniref:Uncharacterized protein n=1 Tax=Monosporascus ibericus TaxID=155417 RepID=A0A4Q4T4B8_9PEZI|nr:hypothetical protein DL764_006590 [Monosporascus ibericus]